MTLDELEKLADESPLITTMATQHLKQLIALCRLQHSALEGMSYWAQPKKTDVPELCGFEANWKDGVKFKNAKKALAAYEEFEKTGEEV